MLVSTETLVDLSIQSHTTDSVEAPTLYNRNTSTGVTGLLQKPKPDFLVSKFYSITRHYSSSPLLGLTITSRLDYSQHPYFIKCDTIRS